MYTFEKEVVGPFTVHKSSQVKGDLHVKRFRSGVTPANQATLNVYISGEFLITCGQFSQSMSAGQTSLELAIDAYPDGALMREEVMSETGVRYCISATEGGKWLREKVSLSGGETFGQDCLIVVLSGQINQKAPGDLLSLRQGEQVSGAGAVVRCWRQAPTT